MLILFKNVITLAFHAISFIISLTTQWFSTTKLYCIARKWTLLSRLCSIYIFWQGFNISSINSAQFSFKLISFRWASDNYFNCLFENSTSTGVSLPLVHNVQIDHNLSYLKGILDLNVTFYSSLFWIVFFVLLWYKLRTLTINWRSWFI